MVPRVGRMPGSRAQSSGARRPRGARRAREDLIPRSGTDCPAERLDGFIAGAGPTLDIPTSPRPADVSGAGRRAAGKRSAARKPSAGRAGRCGGSRRPMRTAPTESGGAHAVPTGASRRTVLGTRARRSPVLMDDRLPRRSEIVTSWGHCACFQTPMQQGLREGGDTAMFRLCKKAVESRAAAGRVTYRNVHHPQKGVTTASLSQPVAGRTSRPSSGTRASSAP